MQFSSTKYKIILLTRMHVILSSCGTYRLPVRVLWVLCKCPVCQLTVLVPWIPEQERGSGITLQLGGNAADSHSLQLHTVSSGHPTCPHDLGHTHCVTPCSTRASLPGPCAYRRSTSIGTHCETLHLATLCAMTDRCLGTPESLGFAPLPERGLVQALCRHEACVTSSPACGLPWRPVPQPHRGGEPVPPKAHCLRSGCSILVCKLLRIIPAALLSYPNVFSLCFLLGWGPLHSLCSNLLSALSVIL